MHFVSEGYRAKAQLWLLWVLAVGALAGCGPPRSPVNAERAVVFDGRLSRQHLPTEGDSLLYAQLHVGPGVVPEPKRSKVNLALVIDSSGSMEGEGIARAKQAAQRMLQVMADGDRLAVVSFDTDVEVLLPSTVIDAAARKRAGELVRRLRAKGTTSMRDGLRAGLAQVREHFDAKGNNGIVLLGDGMPNHPGGIEDLATGAGAQQIHITALGLGLDYNEALMASIAQRSGGRFHYVDEPSKVAGFFKDEVLRMHRVYAKNMQLELVLGPGVEHQLLGHDRGGVARRMTVPLGDLSQRESVEVMLRLNVPGRSDGAAVEILDAKLRYQVPSADGADAEQRVYLGAHASADEIQLAAIDRKLEHAGAMAEASHATLIAVSRARSGQKGEAVKVIDFAIERLRAQSKHGGKKELAGRVDELRTLRGNLPEPQPVPAAEAAEDVNLSIQGDAPPPISAKPTVEQQEQLKRSHDKAVQSFSAY